jgi:hypothetical protein
MGPGGLPGLQNRVGGRKVAGGFDSLPPPPRLRRTCPPPPKFGNQGLTRDSSRGSMSRRLQGFRKLANGLLTHLPGCASQMAASGGRRWQADPLVSHRPMSDIHGHRHAQVVGAYALRASLAKLLNGADIGAGFQQVRREAMSQQFPLSRPFTYTSEAGRIFAMLRSCGMNFEPCTPA